MPSRFSNDEHIEGKPENRRDAYVDDRAGVDAADQGDRDGEQCRVSPTGIAQRLDDERQQPGKRRIGKQNHGYPAGVLHDVRRKRIRQGGGEPPGTLQIERVSEVQDAGAGGKHNAAQPKSLGNPDRNVSE